MTALKCFLLDHGYANSMNTPCCHVPPEVGQDVDSFSTLHNTKLYTEIKQSMDQGIWHDACNECHQIELCPNETSKSKRQFLLQNYTKPDYNPNDGLLDLQLSPGYLCNLQCRSCNPWLSSSWIKENHDMPDTIAIRYSDLGPLKYDYSKDDWSNVKSCSFVGGEPLYNPEFYIQLKRLFNATGGNCTVSITTNGTTSLNLEKYNWLVEFKNVDINLSIDAIGRGAEFIRTGTSWDKVVKNIQFYKSTKPFDNLSFHITNSVLNVLETDKTLKWLESMDIPDCGLITHVTNPAYLDYSVLTDYEKQNIVDQISGTKAEYIIPKLVECEFNPVNRSNFLLFMEHTKNYHGMDWEDYLPDLFNIMNAD